MTDRSFTATIEVDRPALEVFDAITTPRAWWSDAIEGRADEVGAEFVFDGAEHHYWKFEVIELVPGRTVVWRVFDSSTTFVQDEDEWNGTEVRFDITETGGTTVVQFAHVGLTPELECFDGCSMGWTGYITDSLPRLVTAGRGRPGRY